MCRVGTQGAYAEDTDRIPGIGWRWRNLQELCPTLGFLYDHVHVKAQTTEGERVKGLIPIKCGLALALFTCLIILSIGHDFGALTLLPEQNPCLN